MEQTLLILGILGIFTGFIAVMYHMKTRTFTPAYKDTMIQDQKATIDFLKKQVQQLNGRIGNIKAKQIVEIETAPGEDPKQSIMEIVESVKDNVDPRLQKLLNNPKAMDFLINMGMGLHKKYPKEVEGFVSQFLPSVPGIVKGASDLTQPAPVQGL